MAIHARLELRAVVPARISDRVNTKQQLAEWGVDQHKANEAHASEARPVGQGTDCVPSFPAARRGIIACDRRFVLQYSITRSARAAATAAVATVRNINEGLPVREATMPPKQHRRCERS